VTPSNSTPYTLTHADDTQLYASSSPDDVSSVRQRLSDCSADFMNWCAALRFQLITDKTEVMWIGSRHNLSKLANQDLTLTIGTETIKPVAVVRDLGVWLDNELSLRQHIAKVAIACFYQLRRLRQIRRCAGRELTTIRTGAGYIAIGLLQLTVIWINKLYIGRFAEGPKRISSSDMPA